MEAKFWLNLQVHHDFVDARELLAERLAQITPLAKAA